MPRPLATFDSLLADAISRRSVLKIGVAAVAAPWLRGFAGMESNFPRLGFSPVPISNEDTVRVPDDEYDAAVFFAWGDPILPGGPAWRPGNSAVEQRLQAGMHHDGMHFFPKLVPTKNGPRASSEEGVLCVNHEYTDDVLLHDDGVKNWSLDKILKGQAAVGVSVVHVRRDKKMRWSIVDGGRRIDGNTMMDITGPARGHALLRTSGKSFTAGENAGAEVRGTMSNCSSGATPWGTYLTCEENFQDYFKRDAATATALEKKYGIGSATIEVAGWKTTYGWEQFDPRYDADALPARNHPNRYGWIVEIDPLDNSRRPAKRTALGRCRHENACTVIAPDGRACVYTGDDQAFQYIYKFVSTNKMVEGPEARRKNWELLDDGVLHVARFDAGGRGEWLPLTLNQKKLRAEFSSVGEIVINARHAADLMGATKMDRPEWIVARTPGPRRPVAAFYCSLTKNTARKTEQEDGSNPRANNQFGHILEWREDGGDPTRTTFEWKILAQGGDRLHPEIEHRGRGAAQDDVEGKNADFACPDGMFIDGRGILWVQTDVSSSKIGTGVYTRFGNNQMLAIDPLTRKARRFLTGPKGCEVTGITETPDGRTMFVNIQHPGEVAGLTDIEKLTGGWPPNEYGRPRSATVVVQRRDRSDRRPIGT